MRTHFEAHGREADIGGSRMSMERALSPGWEPVCVVAKTGLGLLTKAPGTVVSGVCHSVTADVAVQGYPVGGRGR
ncbi:MAG: hypothetical protein QG582_971 [Candidatus Thermoplasmatota archaeon]|nr:hypothetical protein [Candidatus Thermoplasmatota archaeon]